MKKKILIILFILFGNITYAAFPIVEDMQQELLEEIPFSNNNIEREGTYLLFRNNRLFNDNRFSLNLL